MKISRKFPVSTRISVLYLLKVKSKIEFLSILIFNDFSKIAIFSRFSFRESEQNLNDHNSAKSARKNFKF